MWQHGPKVGVSRDIWLAPDDGMRQNLIDNYSSSQDETLHTCWEVCTVSAVTGEPERGKRNRRNLEQGHAQEGKWI